MRTLVVVVLVTVFVVVLVALSLVVRRQMFGTTPRPTVCVIGSGLAGLAAAVSLAPHASVVVIDCAPVVGGNSIKAKSGMSRPLVPNEEGSRRMMFDDIVRSGRHQAGPELTRVRRLVDDANAAHAWLRVVAGVRLSEAVRTGGHREARTFRPSGGAVGAQLVVALERAARDAGVVFCLGANIRDLRWVPEQTHYRLSLEDGRGQRCHAVVVACGGFAHTGNTLLPPHLRDTPTTNASSSKHSPQLFQVLKERLGVAFKDMDLVQRHPTAIVDPADPTATTKELLPEGVRGCPGVRLVDEDGNEFVDSLAPRDKVVSAMDERKGRRFFVTIPRRDDCLAWIRSAVERKVIATGPTEYVVEVTPALHYSMGGLSVTLEARVLPERGDGVVPFLYAAGECTGGLHGANRLAGNSLLECVVFGRIAAASVLADFSALSEELPVTLITKQPPAPVRRKWTMDDVARHARDDDMWMVVDGTVYDITGYLHSHPAGAQSLRFAAAGRNATAAFRGAHKGGGVGLLESAVLDGSIKIVGTV
jgi:FAD-dependent fumarate reductase